MTDWFVNINFRKLDKNQFSPNIKRRVIYTNIKTKKEVLAMLKEDFPEYFHDKVPQRTSNGEFFYCTIFKYDSIWKETWEQEYTCCYCNGSPRTKLFLANNDIHYREYYCCSECRDKDDERKRLGDNARFNIDGVGYIYKITYKPTGQVYIGKTKNHPIWRWWQHIKARGDSRFYKIMAKSEISDWQFECLEVLKEITDKELYDLEHNYIKKFNATDIDLGLNTKD